MNIKKIIAFSVGPIGSAVIGLISLPIIAWYFSPDDIGRLAMLQVIISLSILLFSLGLDQAYVREYHVVDDHSTLLKEVVLPGLFILIVIFILVYLFSCSVSNLLFALDSALISFLVILSIVFSFISRYLSLILRMQERGGAYSVSLVMPKLIFLFLIVFFVLFKDSLFFTELIVAHFFSIFTVLALLSWNTRRVWKSALRARMNLTRLRHMINYALPLIGSGVAFWGLTSTDKIFLRNFSSFSELGVYSVALSFAAIALIFQAVFTTVWVPTVYKWSSSELCIKKVQQVTNSVAVVILIIWSLVGMLSWLVSYILPDEYAQVQYILLSAMAYPLLYTLSEATGIGIGVTRKTLFSLLAALIALLLNLVGNWYLIPIYGARGAAVSSALAFFTFFVIRTEASSRIWLRLDNRKIYLSIVLVLSISLIANIFLPPVTYVASAFLASFLIFCFWFRTDIISLCKLCFGYVSSLKAR